VRWYAAAALSEMGNEAKLAIPALVTICLEDVEDVEDVEGARTVALDALNKMEPNLDIASIRRISSTKHRKPENNNSGFKTNYSVC